MRTSVTFDDNTYEIAAVYARANGITFSKAINDLVRKAVAPKEEPVKVKIMPDGLPLIPARGRKITPEMIERILDEEYE